MINLIAKPIRRKNNELVDTTGLSWTKKKVDSLFSSENKGNCAENNNDNSKNNSNSESKHGTIAEDAISSPNRAGTVGNSRLSKRGQSPIGKQRTAGVGGTIVGNSNNHSNSYGNNDEEIVGKLLEEVQDKSKTIEGELSVEALRFASSGAGESRTVQCGRVQFDNIPIPPDAPKDLVCEECEKEFSVFKCTACDQVTTLLLLS